MNVIISGPCDKYLVLIHSNNTIKNEGDRCTKIKTLSLEELRKDILSTANTMDNAVGLLPEVYFKVS